MNYAYTTLLGTDDYLYPVLALDYTLKKVKSKYPLVVMVMDDVSFGVLETLRDRNIPYQIFPNLTKAAPYYCRVHDKDNLSGRDLFQVMMMNKFYMFELKEFDKVCYLDGDILIRQNIDFIFNYRTPCGKVLDYRRPFVAGEQLLVNPKDYEFQDIIDKYTIFAHDEVVYCGLYPIYAYADCKITDDACYVLHAHAHGDLYRYWEHFELKTIEALYEWCDKTILDIHNSTFHMVKNIYSRDSTPIVEQEDDIVLDYTNPDEVEREVKNREQQIVQRERVIEYIAQCREKEQNQDDNN